MKTAAILIQKLYGGGAERTAANLSLSLCDRYQVHLVVFDGRNISYPYAGTLHDLKLPPAKGRLGKMVTLLRRARAVRRLKRECAVDAAISLMAGANLVNVLSGGPGTIVTSVRVQMSKSRFTSPQKKRFTLALTRFIARRSDAVAALSEGVRRDLIDEFGLPEDKVVTIYNPCDGALLREKAQLHGADAASMPPLSVTAMGRMTRQKGHWHLLRAFAQVVREVPEAQLYLLGDGPLREELLRLTRALGLEGHVTFLGYREAPHAYVQNSRVFVLPSLFEGLGNVLLEAMACGTPVVAADCRSGPREILAPGTAVRERLPQLERGEYGLLTSVGGGDFCGAEAPLAADEAQLAEAICLLLTDDQLNRHYREMALRRSADFAPEVIAAQWAALLEALPGREG
ncbi:MAG: glycosyltransferase [Clostridiales bacterium]|nr:glycosyltransferase [Clostridiales bacterium]